MFGLGMGEILVIAIVALLFLGPEKLPGAAKSLSKGIRDLRRHTKELQRTIEDDTQVGDAIRDLKSALRGENLDPYVPPHVNKDDADAPKTHKASATPPAGAQEPGPTDENEAPAQYTYGNDSDEAAPLIRPAADTVASTPALEATPAVASATRPTETPAGPAPKSTSDDKAHG